MELYADVGFSAASLLGFFVDGSVEAFEAASLFALYLVYLVVLFTGRRVRRLLRKTIEFLKGELDSGDESSIDWDDSSDEDVAAPMLDDANREDEETGGDENRSDDGRDESESDADAETASDTSLEETCFRAVVGQRRDTRVKKRRFHFARCYD